jgi:hypothetical protein
LVTDLLVAVVIEAQFVDGLFGDSVSVYAEGEVAGRDASHSRPARIPFTSHEVTRRSTVEPMQAAGAALVSLVWEHRLTLLRQPTSPNGR